MEERDQIDAPAAIPPVMCSVTHSIGGDVGCTAGLEFSKKRMDLANI